MEPTVLSGDHIIVNKLIPGPRLYRNFQNIKIDGKVQTKRFKGIHKVQRNDILFFNFPYSGGWDKIDMDLNVFYLKRCVGLPSDTFLIENGIYKVKGNKEPLGCVFRQQELSLMLQNNFPQNVWNCFPSDTINYKWNIKDFGPLFVPASGSSLVLDTLNFSLYKNLIEYETGIPLSVHEGLIYLGDEKINIYIFKENYYFVAGDYIFDSIDSRYWGLLPEDCIVGKAIFIWKSIDPKTGNIRWKRMLKKIDK